MLLEEPDAAGDRDNKHCSWDFKMQLMPFTVQVLCAQAEAEKQDMTSLHEDLEPSNGGSCWKAPAQLPSASVGPAGMDLFVESTLDFVWSFVSLLVCACARQGSCTHPPTKMPECWNYGTEGVWAECPSTEWNLCELYSYATLLCNLILKPLLSERDLNLFQEF